MALNIKEVLAAFRARKEMVRELNALRKLVFYDELTGVLNRRGFRDEAEKAFRAVYPPARFRDRRSLLKLPFCVLFMDLDNFKHINDSFGHAVGDRVLKRTGVVLRKALRTEDLFGRWGGEEFVVALLGARVAQAHMVAERIRRNVQHMNLKVLGRRVPTTASIGLASHAKEKDLSELIRNADKAMYQAKKKGKNRVIEFS